jgi:hypothetical protein
MKTNSSLGFAPLYDDNYPGGDGEYTWIDAGDSLTLDAFIGKREGTYRVYAYLWHSDHDASREGKRGECCGRGDTPDQAMAAFRHNALAIGWDARPVDEALLEMAEEIAELAGQSPID